MQEEPASNKWFDGAYVIHLNENEILKVVKSPVANVAGFVLALASIALSWQLVHLNPNDFFRFANYNFGVTILILLFLTYAYALFLAVKENAMDFAAVWELGIKGKKNGVTPEKIDAIRFKSLVDIAQTMVSFLPGIFWPEETGMFGMLFAIIMFFIGEWAESKTFGMNFATYNKVAAFHNKYLSMIGFLCVISQLGFLGFAFNKYNQWFISVTTEERYMNDVDIYFPNEVIPKEQTNWEIEGVQAESYGNKGQAATPDGKTYYYVHFRAIGKFVIPELANKEVTEMEFTLFTDFKLQSEVNILRIMREQKAKMREGIIMNQSGAGNISQSDKILLFQRLGNRGKQNGVKQNTDIFGRKGHYFAFENSRWCIYRCEFSRIEKK